MIEVAASDQQGEKIKAEVTGVEAGGQEKKSGSKIRDHKLFIISGLVLACLAIILLALVIYLAVSQASDGKSSSEITSDEILSLYQEGLAAQEEIQKQEAEKARQEAEVLADHLAKQAAKKEEILGSWYMILANTDNPIPEDHTVDLVHIYNGYYCDDRIYDALMTMIDDARAEGLDPIVVSAYRSKETQTYLINESIKKYISYGYSPEPAEAEALKWRALPGTSEHQTGLALDIMARSYYSFTEDQENTEEQIWLMAHAHNYGFILRYPKDKVDITGINYEPWHYRYVGIEAAGEIYARGWSLEEFIENIEETDYFQNYDSKMMQWKCSTTNHKK